MPIRVKPIRKLRRNLWRFNIVTGKLFVESLFAWSDKFNLDRSIVGNLQSKTILSLKKQLESRIRASWDFGNAKDRLTSLGELGFVETSL